MMPSPALSRSSPRARRMGPSCRGGASSLLRLSQPVATRWPSASALADWAQRATNVALATDWPVAESHHSIIARLLPLPEMGFGR